MMIFKLIETIRCRMGAQVGRHRAVNKLLAAELMMSNACKPWIRPSNTDNYTNVLDEKVDKLICERYVGLKIRINAYQIEDGWQSMPPPVRRRKVNSYATGDLTLLITEGMFSLLKLVEHTRTVL